VIHTFPGISEPGRWFSRCFYCFILLNVLHSPSYLFFIPTIDQIFVLHWFVLFVSAKFLPHSALLHSHFWPRTYPLHLRITVFVLFRLVNTTFLSLFCSLHSVHLMRFHYHYVSRWFGLDGAFTIFTFTDLFCCSTISYRSYYCVYTVYEFLGGCSSITHSFRITTFDRCSYDDFYVTVSLFDSIDLRSCVPTSILGAVICSITLSIRYGALRFVPLRSAFIFHSPIHSYFTISPAVFPHRSHVVLPFWIFIHFALFWAFLPHSGASLRFTPPHSPTHTCHWYVSVLPHLPTWFFSLRFVGYFVILQAVFVSHYRSILNYHVILFRCLLFYRSAIHCRSEFRFCLYCWRTVPTWCVLATVFYDFRTFAGRFTLLIIWNLPLQIRTVPLFCVTLPRFFSPTLDTPGCRNAYIHVAF